MSYAHFNHFMGYPGCQDAKDMTNRTMIIWTKRFKCQRVYQPSIYEYLILPAVLLLYIGFHAFRYFTYRNARFVETPYDLLLQHHGYWPEVDEGDHRQQVRSGRRIMEQQKSGGNNGNLDVARKEDEDEEESSEGGSPRKRRLRRRDVHVCDPEGKLSQSQQDI